MYSTTLIFEIKSTKNKAQVNFSGPKINVTKFGNFRN